MYKTIDPVNSVAVTTQTWPCKDNTVSFLALLVWRLVSLVIEGAVNIHKRSNSILPIESNVILLDPPPTSPRKCNQRRPDRQKYALFYVTGVILREA